MGSVIVTNFIFLCKLKIKVIKGPTENLFIELNFLYNLLKSQAVKISTKLSANFTNLFSACNFKGKLHHLKRLLKCQNFHTRLWKKLPSHYLEIHADFFNSHKMPLIRKQRLKAIDKLSTNYGTNFWAVRDSRSGPLASDQFSSFSQFIRVVSAFAKFINSVN